jgi:parallel beta-helix repeat protein
MIKKIAVVWVSLAILLGIVVIVDVVTDIVPPVNGGNPPPPDDNINGTQYINGDWEVTGNEVYTNETIILTGNLFIRNGGILTFYNVTLKMNSTDDGDNEFKIEVENGGEFYIYDNDDDNTTVEDASAITNNTNKYFLFNVYDGAKLVMKNSELSGCRYKTMSSHSTGIKIYSDDILFDHNIIKNNYLALVLFDSSGTISNNTITNNDRGIYISGGNPIVYGNYIVNNSGTGIFCMGSATPLIDNNILISNGWAAGISVVSSSPVIINTTIISSSYWGIQVFGSTPLAYPVAINCSIYDSGSGDIWLDDGVQLTLINTQFNESSVTFDNGAPSTTTLIVQWYLHINIIDYLTNPVPNAEGEIEDNINGTNSEFFISDYNGYMRWITVTEYIEQDTDGDTFGEKTYHTPHKIVAWNNTLVGCTQPFMNESKTVTIILFNGTLLDLEPGWNLISLPRSQSISNPLTILQPIEEQYDAVQRYNATDQNDPWKHLHILKPSHLNDLYELDPYMGFWIHITDPGGTTLAVFGEEFTTDQIIPLYKGWNLVGYPSSMIRVPDFGLPTSVDLIQWYNGSSGLWESWDPGSYSSDSLISIKPGHGLWIHCTQVYDEWILEHYSPPQVDWIEIVDTAGVGATVIPNLSIDVDQTIWGYAAAFNISAGYLGDIIVTWSVQNSGGANASTNPTIWDSSGFYSGDFGGTAIWTADDGNSHTDSISITINSP